ncbi:MAG: hypothetical protein AB1656_21145 [Candidatus Omnitrophota bacterium]
MEIFLEDSLEDIGMVQAIEEGLKTPKVDQEEALSWIASRLQSLNYDSTNSKRLLQN